MLRSTLRTETPTRERPGSYSRRRRINPPTPSTTSTNEHPAVPSPSVLTPWQRDAGFDQVFSLSRDALVVTELPSGRILRWNPAAERLFGYAADDIIGKSIEVLLPAAVARLHRERITHYLRTDEAEVLTVRAPLGMPVLTRSGDELRANMTIAPLQAPGSPRGALLLAFRDATCEKELELQSLETAHAQAARLETETRLRRCEELLRDNRRVLAAPVARARRSAARLARLTEAESSAAPRRLAVLTQVVQYRTDEVWQVLEQLSDMTDIRTGAFELRPERVNLVPLLSRVVSTTRGRTETHRLKLAAPQGLTAHCDPARIEAVVRDLIQRAIRRNPRGCWIDIDLRRPLAGTAEIEVRDYGRPMSPRERERYMTATDDRGWLISRHVVEQHGGKLAMELPPEGGVRVIIRLPTHRARLARSRGEDHGCIT